MLNLIKVLPALLLLITTNLYALPKAGTKTQPKFSIVPCRAGENKGSIGVGERATVCYVVTNNTKITRSLNMRPITAVEQIITESLPFGVNLPHKQCGSSTLSLASKESCVLILNIHGDELPSHGIFGGPVIGLSVPYALAANQFLSSQPASGEEIYFVKSGVNRYGLLAGSYIDTDSIQRPLLAIYPISVATGDTTQKITFPYSLTQPNNAGSPPSPEFSTNGILNGVICYQETPACIAVGSYQDNTGTRQPLLVWAPQAFPTASSSETWRYVNVSNAELDPTYKNDGQYLSIAGAAQQRDRYTSVSVGSYKDDNDKTHPLGAISNTTAENLSTANVIFVYPDNLTDPKNAGTPPTPTYKNNGIFKKAFCNAIFCAVAGSYNDENDIQHPLYAYSTDIVSAGTGSTTWIYPAEATNPSQSTTPPNPAFSKEGVYNAIYCDETNSVCLEGGSYQDSNSKQHPLLGVGSGATDTVNYPNSVSNPTLSTAPPSPTYSQNGVVNAVYCNTPGQSNSICIAAGSYQDTSGNTQALLAYSTDGGTTWLFSNSIQYGTGGNIESISCKTDICYVTGSYIDTSGVQQILLAYTSLLQSNRGSSWIQADVTNSELLPSFSNDGVLKNIFCSNDECLSGGSYLDSSNITNPVAALSYLNDTIWSYLLSLSIPSTDPAFASSGVYNQAYIVNGSNS